MTALGSFIRFIVLMTLMLAFPVVGLVLMPCWLLFRLTLLIGVKVKPSQRMRRWVVLTKRPPLWFDLTDMHSAIPYLEARVCGMSRRQALRQVVSERRWYTYRALKKLEPIKNAQGFELVYESRIEGWQEITSSLGGSLPPPGRYVWRKKSAA